MDMSNIVSGRQQRPYRIAIYGQEGVGKSSFGAGAPNPIFICAEDGTAALDVARFIPQTFDDVMGAITSLYTEDHDFKTVVLDSADWAEVLCQRKVCDKHNLDSIEDMGYGKGYTMTFELFNQILDGLNALYQAKKMNIVIIAHAEIKAFNDPTAESYDTYHIKAHKKIASRLKEWGDVLGFAKFDTRIEKDKSGFGKAKAKSYGKRELYVVHAAGYEAKNRYNITGKLPLDWKVLDDAIKQSMGFTAPQAVTETTAAA